MKRLPHQLHMFAIGCIHKVSVVNLNFDKNLLTALIELFVSINKDDEAQNS